MSDDATLDPCGCCEGVSPATPVEVANRPGLSALAWRAGTQARFKRSMLSGLSGEEALRALSTRADDDPTIALADAWATALDVLTFYQERFANEHYLRTATERRSILELARAIGYELAPGVSASAYLAFKLETAETAPLETTVPAGTKVQSIPGQDEKPQLYETTEDLTARGAWNELRVRQKKTKTPVQGQEKIHLLGVSSGLQPGDALLIVGDERLGAALDDHWDFRRVRTATPVNDPTDPTKSYTEVVLDRKVGSNPPQTGVKVYGMRQRVGLFGGTAPDWALMPEETRTEISGEGDLSKQGDWPDFTIGYADAKPTSLSELYLDSAAKAAVQDSWLIVTTAPTKELLFRIEEAEESGLTKFAVSGKSTRVELSGDTTKLVDRFWKKLRQAAVFLQTEEFTLVERPRTDAIEAGATSVDLDTLLTGDDGIPAERTLIVSGEDPTSGEAVAEVVTLQSVSTVGGGEEITRTRLTFTSALKNSYARATAVVRGNVVLSNHGETRKRTLPDGLEVTEVLGSGDGSLPFQKFTLKQTPLTYVSATNPSGRETTLEVRVDGVKWEQVSTLYGVGPEERVYIVRLADDGKATVQFGDGLTGARLPTGSENISALYRVGTGLEGLVDAGQLTLLMSRPVGLKEAVNPLASSGAEDAEELADARDNAPLTVLTLDRIVSLLDYEDFARAYAGIGKAAVTPLWTDEKQTVHLTVALSDGGVPPVPSTTVDNLKLAIDGARHGLLPVVVQGYVDRPFSVTATIAVDPDYDEDVVVADVTAALREKFAFAEREFSQDVTVAETIATMQGVAGVVYVDLDLLAFNTGEAAADGRLQGRPARLVGSTITAADLLTLAEADIHLTPKAP